MKITTLNHFSRRNALPQLFKDKGFNVGVEIGTDRGEYAEILLNKIPNLKLYCIDPWAAYTEGTDVKTQADVEKILEKALSRISERAEVIRQTSMHAVKEFQDNRLDFVFIDGNHSYDYVLEDITEWTKKVKPGGIVCGHDYKVDKEKEYGVIEAVNDYCTAHNIDFYILHAGGKLVDCWAFVKGGGELV